MGGRRWWTDLRHARIRERFGVEESRLQGHGIELLGNAGQIAGRRMATLAIPRTVEVVLAGLGVTDDHILNFVRHTVGFLLSLTMKKGGDIGNLGLTQWEFRHA